MIISSTASIIPLALSFSSTKAQLTVEIDFVYSEFNSILKAPTGTSLTSVGIYEKYKDLPSAVNLPSAKVIFLSSV